MVAQPENYTNNVDINGKCATRGKNLLDLLAGYIILYWKTMPTRGV